MAAPEEQQIAAKPDWALVSNGRLPDNGPRYTETPADPYSPNAPSIAEPWNTITASSFIFIVGYWAWRLRGRYRSYPFLCCCMPILLAGGIGGTLYHATRISKVYFYLDVVPISVLGIAGAVFMALRCWGGRGWWFVPGVAVFYIAVNRLLFFALAPMDIQWAVNLSYASLAIVVLIPIGLVLLRTRFRYAGWVVAGVISFAIAWFFRLVDLQIASRLPMGSHWLWHTFGAITTLLIIEYFYLVEGEVKLPSVNTNALPSLPSSSPKAERGSRSSPPRPQ
jgi:hypothetical protein